MHPLATHWYIRVTSLSLYTLQHEVQQKLSKTTQSWPFQVILILIKKKSHKTAFRGSQNVLKPSRNKKGRKCFQFQQKWCLFLQLRQKNFWPFLFCDDFKLGIAKENYTNSIQFPRIVTFFLKTLQPSKLYYAMDIQQWDEEVHSSILLL